MARPVFSQKKKNQSADVKAGIKTGRTPLHWAALHYEPPAVITALLEIGADPKAKDKGNKTPWDYAQDNEALKNSGALWFLNDLRF